MCDNRNVFLLKHPNGPQSLGHNFSQNPKNGPRASGPRASDCCIHCRLSNLVLKISISLFNLQFLVYHLYLIHFSGSQITSMSCIMLFSFQHSRVLESFHIQQKLDIARGRNTPRKNFIKQINTNNSYFYYYRRQTEYFIHFIHLFKQRYFINVFKCL